MNDVAAKHGLPWLIGAIETHFSDLRRRPADVHAALASALAQCGAGHLPERIAKAGTRIAAAVNAAADASPELAYHNRHHTAEAVLAMGWLLEAARRAGMIDPDLAALGVLAMLGHDIFHDGSAPGNGELEERSAAAVEVLAAEAGLTARERAVIRAVIAGTNPCRIGENAARAASMLPTGPLGHHVDLLIAMANEADVLASLMPSLGAALTADLARERAACGDSRADEVMTFASRLRFLRGYEQQTEAARALGLDAIVRQQIEAFGRFGTTAEEGAAALDMLRREDALRRYQAALN